MLNGNTPIQFGSELQHFRDYGKQERYHFRCFRHSFDLTEHPLSFISPPFLAGIFVIGSQAIPSHTLRYKVSEEKKKRRTGPGMSFRKRISWVKMMQMFPIVMAIIKKDMKCTNTPKLVSNPKQGTKRRGRPVKNDILNVQGSIPATPEELAKVTLKIPPGLVKAQ